MNVFAELGYDVWTMDHENYGRSSRTEGNSDIASGVEDLIVATALVLRESGAGNMHMLGESSGALRAAAFAMERPVLVDRLILNAFTYTGHNSPTLKKRAEELPYFRTHNRRVRDRDMIRSIFTRDHPGTSDLRVADALADTELQFGDQVPTGTYLDMCANLPVVDPARVLCPTMLIRGEHDGIASEEDLLDFYAKLPNPDRQFVVLSARGARPRVWSQPAPILARDARFPLDAAATGRTLTGCGARGWRMQRAMTKGAGDARRVRAQQKDRGAHISTARNTGAASVATAS
jgi:pimeloyl-ACP methyl ester carboxylesterase